MSFELHSYRLLLECTGDVDFKSFPGIALRGGLGRSLYDVCCSHRERNECEGCPRESRCAFALLFRPRGPLFGLDQKRYRQLPRPVAMRPRAHAGTYPAGSTFTVEMTLAGASARGIPFMLDAWRRLGGEGVGSKRKSPGAGTFRLVSAHATGPDREERIYDARSGSIRAVELPWRFPEDFCGEAQAEASSSRFMLELVTPTLIGKEGKERGSLEFVRLIAALLTRASLLSQAYGKDGEVIGKEAYLDLKRAAESVTIEDRSCAWVDWPRFSRRQNRRMRFGGWKGRITYEGEVARWLPWLRLARLLHVGKRSMFGWGEVRLVERAGAPMSPE